MDTEQPTLRSKRLILRPFAPSDAIPLYVFFADPAATQFWGNPHTSHEETQAFVDGTCAADPATSCDFIIEYEGRVIGKAGMWAAPEIGFFVLPAHQRQGFAYEALCTILPYLFEHYALDALTADVDPDNHASLALLTKLGFSETDRAARTLQIGTRWCDSVFLALPRSI